MKVQILRDGVYLDDGLRRKKRRAGELLETKERYGHSLIQDGLAKEVFEVALKPKRVVKKKQPAGKKSGGSGKAGNPFLP